MSILITIFSKIKNWIKSDSILIPSLFTFLCMICILILVLLSYCQKNTSVSQLKQLENTYEAEIAQINSLREQENIEHQENLKQLQSQLSSIQSQYDTAKKELATLKQKRTNNIIQETKGNPDELAKRLSNVTGIPIVR